MGRILAVVAAVLVSASPAFAQTRPYTPYVPYVYTPYVAAPIVAPVPVWTPPVYTPVVPVHRSGPPVLVGADGTFLGVLSPNKYDPLSVSNPYGAYGSKYSPTSITNPYSVYGSPYSPLSATNPYSIAPPVVKK